jgi:hypothetical protein
MMQPGINPIVEWQLVRGALYKGNSGGPLLCKREQGWVIIGLLCSDFQKVKVVTVFDDKVLAWVESVISKPPANV